MIEISDNYWENVLGVSLAFALLALTIERALYQIFDSKLWRSIEANLDKGAGGDFLRLPGPEAMDFCSCLRYTCLSPQRRLHRRRP